MGKVTLQTIADRVGVSRMTVSNAFSRPGQLSDELRARILAAAEELGYVGPDPAARALARGATGAVGVLLTDSLDYAFTDEVAIGFLRSFAEGLGPMGLALTLLTTDNRGEVVPARDVALDGAVVYSCRSESEARDWLVRRKLPLVFVDQDPAPHVGCVNVDDRGGARAAAQHLVDLGHRRVGILTLVIDGEEGVIPDPAAAARGHVQTQRITGWVDALEATGVKPVVVQTPDNTDRIRDVLRHLLAEDERPTAMLCFSDVLASGVLAAAREAGLRVPGDLSVVGFDDSPVARRADPPLTTVSQDVSAKGHLAAEALIDAIEHARFEGRHRVRHRTVPTELIIRGSTAPPPAAIGSQS